jgi:nitrogenase molybdenum-iron protein alpha/beta subunit
VGTEGVSPAVIGANQDAVLVVIERIVQHGIKIRKANADVNRQDYPHSIAAAAGGVMILDQLEPVIGYQFV